MEQNSAFFGRSLQVVDRFLQTAVVIDDRAFRREERVEALPQLIEAPPTPSTAVPVGEKPVERSPEASPILAIVPVPDTDPHGLDAEAVIDSFARRGIVCSVLKRVPDENPADPGQSARRLFSPADILIIDWQVHRADGSDTNEETLDFVETAVKDSARDTPRQLRLIIVYTGATDLLEVVDKVEERLKGAGGNPLKDGDFAFRAGAVRVVIIGKPSNYRGESKNQQVVNDSEIASRAAMEFAVMTAGLVSNVALSSLAEIRKATHRLLSRFGPHLDAPFLAHRALLDPPDTGNEHLVPLIVSEFEAILEDQIPPDLLSDDSVRDWLLTRKDPTPILDSSPALTTPEKARRMVEEVCVMGVDQHAHFSIPTQPTWLKKIADGKGVNDLSKLTDIIAAEHLANSNERLEILMSIRPRYGPKRPALALGSLLSSLEGNGTFYWLCLQPACACYIRTEAPRRRAFPLLKLDLVDERFNIIAETDDTFIRLRWLPHPHRQRMVEFEANSPSGAVVAESVDGKFWLPAADSDLKYRWLGDLKFAQAQRVAHAMAGEAARVGLTESEWLRRTAK